MSYTHLSITEREQLQKLLWEKKSIRYIAHVLDRSPSSISRELRRNFPKERKVYTPRLAQARATEKTQSRGRKDKLKTKEIREYVITHLKKRWSPEQIALRIKIDLNKTISHEAIYQYIYSQIQRNGFGDIQPGTQDLRIYLRRRRKRRQAKGARRYQRVLVPQGTSIDDRPLIVERRVRIGDWESDTVESVNHKPGVNTLLERKTGLYLITKVSDKTSAATITAIRERMKYIPQQRKKTMTFDNGPENSNWRAFEHTTGIKSYYAHPYHSWERGSNENTNGLLRDYFPKGTDFTMITEEEIQEVEHSLNTRPRKRLGGKTPLEVWGVALRS